MADRLQRRMAGMRYEDAGVDYDVLDAFKRACQRLASPTAAALDAHGLREPPGVRGESAYLVETPTGYLAHVEEGLGTKNLVADEVAAAGGGCHYRAIGTDTVATIVNDLVTAGALPVVVAMHAAVGDTAWFADAARAGALADGFAHGCRLSGATWGGGETPVLRDTVRPEAIVLAGSAVGIVSPRERRITGDVRDGDAIVLVASSGVHTNGLTLCRAIARRLAGGWQTPLPGTDTTYGAAILVPSVVYVPLVAALQRGGIQPRYAVHVTGHGWRKLMRLEAPFVYRLTAVREPPALFRFLMDAGPMDLRDAYATFNMGVGFALMVRGADAARTVDTARTAGFDAWVGGEVRHDRGRKAVEIVPAGITFAADSLAIR
jgi:phosphoribosylformylglycinamidine cyclo-ligase